MASADSGTIASLRLCLGHREPMCEVETVDIVAGYGIEGDRHATRGRARAHRQVLLMAQETLAAFGLAPGEVRENITTQGLALQELQPGDRVALGSDAVLEITEDCEPCERMDELRQGLRTALDGKRGMLATVLESGTVRAGDAVRVVNVAAAR